MELYHEFFGSDNYEERRSQVWRQEPDTWFVKFFEKDSHVADRLIVGHTERYAEDCAENWVIGVIKV